MADYIEYAEFRRIVNNMRDDFIGVLAQMTAETATLRAALQRELDVPDEKIEGHWKASLKELGTYRLKIAQKISPVSDPPYPGMPGEGPQRL